MPLPVSFYNLKINDNTVRGNGQVESSSVNFPIATTNGANIAAVATWLTALNAAIDGIVIGNLASSQQVLKSTLYSAVPAASPLAQRENKWLCRYHDNTTLQKGSVSIGTADLTLLTDNSEFLDITAGVGLAFKDAFEDVVVSPYNDANPVTLDSVQFVGRNT